MPVLDPKELHHQKGSAMEPKLPLGRVRMPRTVESAGSEVTEISILTRFGATFEISRKSALGSLLRLELPLAVELRAYDREKDLYSVIGLVQYCNEVSRGFKIRFNTSVIFIGKHFPNSYFSNPDQTYRLTGASRDGMWNIIECEYMGVPRRHPRFDSRFEVEVGLIQRSARSVRKERAITGNVGLSGASLITAINAQVGDKLKIACADIEFYTIAEVVNQKHFYGLQNQISVKFIDSEFPITRVLLKDKASTD